ncbi:MAG TPA: hypothetical protein VFP68_09080 [Burkholderiaceae bacterium]|nr:hypothetical protein [Burkholderiaceae bacterium]
MQRMRTLSSTRRWLIWLALWAAVGTQWLALAHGVIHAGGTVAGMQVPSANALNPVLGHDEGSPLCKLFDQLAHGVPPVDVASLAVSPWLDALPADPDHTAVARSVSRSYLARAPPFLIA